MAFFLGSDGQGQYVAKALELFMADLVQNGSNITIQRGAKRLEAYHL